ncbi:MAG: siphovirus Gp157 family protein [Candidatus Cloacimonetes bacterium]|nr:siphovirus Gp157 family protein [Candidatus Cloacimonadota bacterium]
MKMTNYRLQTEMERIKPQSQEWFKDYVRQVLESNKPYHAKADYIGLSIQELQNKIDYLAEDIKEMSALKKSLIVAKETALEAIADVLAEYGIDRLDGTAISSITMTPRTTKIKESLSILDEDALIKLGYFKVIVDVDAVKEAMKTLESMDEIDRYTQVEVHKETIPARIKVNAKRTGSNNQAAELLTLVDAQAVA